MKEPVKTSTRTAANPKIVSQQEWEAARQHLLVKEKGLTRSRDALAAERRRMPWMAVEKKYEFDGPKGTRRPRRTSGGTGTTTTTPRPHLTRSGSRCPTLEKPPFESPTLVNKAQAAEASTNVGYQLFHVLKLQ